ncbi:MAG: hypothetical protein O7A98_04205 [Acidobacteria bacterium]|nr:hypothetical protein [Acidobacteriota bacterium]MCZ6726539.1 hypothetical protein [Acidobacteriota bacterium]
MKMAAKVARYLLGVGMVVFGANAFFDFMPPPELSEQGGEFLGLMFASGYFNWVAILKIAGGLMLILGRFVPLGLTLLGPILVNILLFHISFDPAGIGLGALFTILWFIVFWDHRTAFQALWTSG